jgi:hypothetical protein
MKNFTLRNLLSGLAAVSLCAPPAFAAKPVPCEKMLNELQTTIATAHLNDTDNAKVKELEKKGIERCSADDDIHADEIFAKALKIMGQ